MPIEKLSIKVRRYRTIQTASSMPWPFPVHANIRFAKLDEDAPSLGVRGAFRPETTTDLEGFQPNMVAGSVASLHRLAECKDLGIIELTSLDKALVAITRCYQAPLNDVSRVVFWQAFGVPVYEVFIGLDNSILGYECELHEGWHLAPHVRLSEVHGELVVNGDETSGLRTGLGGFVTAEECPCGRPGERLMSAERIQSRKPVQHLSQSMNLAAIA